MTNADNKWIGEWFAKCYNAWSKHCEWCSTTEIVPKTWRESFLEQITANLLHHRTTKARNRRMRQLIVETWTTFEACEIINELDLNS